MSRGLFFHVSLPLLMLSMGWPSAGEAIDLFVRSPRDNQVVFGEVEVALEVLSAEPLQGIEIRLDGEVVGVLEEPPYRMRVDVGEENRSRTFEITALDVNGESAT